MHLGLAFEEASPEPLAELLEGDEIGVLAGGQPLEEEVNILLGEVNGEGDEQLLEVHLLNKPEIVGINFGEGLLQSEIHTLESVCDLPQDLNLPVLHVLSFNVLKGARLLG